MRRVKPDYITVRIDQLKEDMDKTSKDYDKAWYNRIIQELSWAQDNVRQTDKKSVTWKR